MTESLVYAMAGGLLSFVLYAATMKIAYATLPEVIPGMEAQPATFGFTAIFVLATTIVFGLAPALHATSADIGEVIKNSGTQSIRRSRLQAAFVVAQLACSQPVLVVTSLVLADLRRGVNENADKAPATVVTMSTEFIRPIPVRPDSDAIRDSIAVTNRTTLGLIRQRLARVPGLQSAAIRHVDGRETYESTSAASATATSLQMSQVFVTPEFWATMGIPIARGRGFGVEDDRAGSTVALVNAEVAKRLWPGEDPIGKRLVRRVRDASPKAASLEVIGVVGRAAYEEEQQTPELYLPLSNAPSVLEPTMIARTSGDARASMPQIRVAIREIDPYIAVGNVVTLAERYAARKREAFLSNAAAFAIGAVALLLASLGLYAIIAFSVAQRTREIGIRLAMGATPHGVVRHFLRHGVRVSAIALAIGVPATVAGIRIVQANVIGFTIESFVTVMLVVPALIGVAVIASWLPARRAGRVDPLIALRSE
jgi:predicted permease